jgi:hypothetical protein
MNMIELRVREARTEMVGTVQYSYGTPEDCGVARWCDVSRAGASVRLGRYLRPGRELTLHVNSPLAASGPLTVRARVVWCAPLGDAGQYAAGLMVYRDTPEMALDFAALGYAARQQANGAAQQAETNKPMWTLYPLRSDARNYGTLSQAQAV